MKKKCELCKSPANMHCKSDQASLCWNCDTRVHTANFLVARHSRTLLCYSCQAPTLWHGSGPKLGRTVSFCETCSKISNQYRPRSHEVDANNDEDDDDDEEDYEDGENDDSEDEENQIVPCFVDC